MSPSDNTINAELAHTAGGKKRKYDGEDVNHGSESKRGFSAMRPEQIIDRFTTPDLKALSTTAPKPLPAITYPSATINGPTIHSNTKVTLIKPQPTPSSALSNSSAEKPPPSSMTSKIDEDPEITASVRLCEEVVVQVLSKAQLRDRQKIAELSRIIRNMQVEAAIVLLENEIFNAQRARGELYLYDHVGDLLNELPGGGKEEVKPESAETRSAREEQVKRRRRMQDHVQVAEDKVLQGVVGALLARKV